MMVVTIEPISEETLEPVCTLACAIFPDEVEAPPVDIRNGFLQQSYTDGFTGHLVSNIAYWAARNERAEVVGFVGLYENDIDAEEAVWIGWYGVDSKERGRGIGSDLLDFVIEQATLRQKKFLRVYTSTFPEEELALQMYKERGFRIVHKEPFQKDASKDILHLELMLPESN